MTVNDILILARQRLGDMQKIQYSDVELIYCLNNAIDRISAELANRFDPEITRVITLSGQTPLDRPSDFIAFQGQFPVKFIYNEGQPQITHLDPHWTDDMEIRYFATMNHVHNLTDEIPFTRVMFQKQLLQYLIYEAKPSLERDTLVTPSAKEGS